MKSTGAGGADVRSESALIQGYFYCIGQTPPAEAVRGSRLAIDTRSGLARPPSRDLLRLGAGHPDDDRFHRTRGSDLVPHLVRRPNVSRHAGLPNLALPVDDAFELARHDVEHLDRVVRVVAGIEVGRKRHLADRDLRPDIAVVEEQAKRRAALRPIEHSLLVRLS